MKKYLTTILWLLSFVLRGQDYSIPKMKLESNTAKGFSPKCWQVSDSIQGDLNKDQLDDIVFVLAKNDSLMMTDKYGFDYKVLPAVLVVALMTESGKYMISEMNKQILIDYNSPRTYYPPFNSMQIENNVLILHFTFDYMNGNFYFYTYKFRSQKNQFVLIGADSEYMTRSDMDYQKASYNFLTRKWSWTTGIHSKYLDPTSVKETTEWFDLELKQLRTFSSMGLPGSWEITKDKWL